MDYKTVAAPERIEYTEKRSKFIASVSPVSDEQEAQSFISKVKSEFNDARHNVFAYVLKDKTERFSDDGEPQGTAGMPLLENIRRRNLVNTGVVVTRYFGGILLGAPGLVRAYNHSASSALDSAKTVFMRECTVLKLILTYDFYARAEILINSVGGIINSRNFTENVELQIYMPKDLVQNFHRVLTEASGAKFAAVEIGETYIQQV